MMKRILIAGNVNECGEMINPIAYQDAVRDAGAAPAVCYARDAQDARTLCDAYDALLLCGGADVMPSLYHASKHPLTICASAARDQSDRTLFEAFYGAGKRILGICRGCQFINAMLGGTLHQHLPDVFTPMLPHIDNKTGRHDVMIAPDSVLAQMFGEGKLSVNSSHHQAMDRLAPGLRMTARATDGVAEAAEGDRLLLVQWHPEAMDATMRPIFAWMMEE